MHTPDERTDPTTPASNENGRHRKGLATGLAVGLLGGTAAGFVFGVPGLSSASSPDVGLTAVVEQSSDPDPDADRETETDTDSNSETDTDEDVRVERGTRLRESLQDLVDDGTLTEEQADAVVAHLVDRRPDGGFEGRGPGGRHVGGPFGRGAGVVSEVLTDLLGLDPQELREQLRDGATLAEIATAQGVEPHAVIDELVAEVEERLDHAVENGRIDRADADEKLAEATERISERVENGRPERGDPDPAD